MIAYIILLITVSSNYTCPRLFKCLFYSVLCLDCVYILMFEQSMSKYEQYAVVDLCLSLEFRRNLRRVNVQNTLYLTERNQDQNQPLFVYIGNSSGDLSGMYYGSSNDGTGRYWLQLDPPRLLNTIRIEHNNTAQHVLVLCEILVYDKGL